MQLPETVNPDLRARLCAGIRELKIPQEPRPAVSAEIRVERHPFSECVFCVAGECKYLLNGEMLTLSPGVFCWIRPWIPHQYGFRPSGGWCEQLWFSMHPGEIRYGLFRSRENGLFLARSPQGKLPGEYPALFHRLAEEWEASRADELRMRRFFELILCEAAGGPGNRREGDDRDGDGIVGALKSCIRTRNGANCSLAELERVFSYSRSHLSHLFRAETGISIGEYIHQVRSEYVERAMRRGLKNKELAAELGFSSPAAFWLWRERRRRREQRELGE